MSGEAVSRKPYPHVCIFQNSMPLQIFIVAVSNPSAHNVHHNCKNHNFCWWDLHSRSLEVNMFFICTQHESRFWHYEIIKHLSQIKNLLLLFTSYTAHTHHVLSWSCVLELSACSLYMHNRMFYCSYTDHFLCCFKALYNYISDHVLFLDHLL